MIIDNDDLKTFSFDIPPPKVIFEYRFFIFTGHFLSIKRKFCEEEVIRRGGVLKLNRLTNYLVVGDGLDRISSPLNNKIEFVLSLKKKGVPIAFISESHFKNSLEAKANDLFADKIKIESFSIPGCEYDVSLKDLTCACPNFIEDRSGFLVDNPIRLCKHLIRALVDAKYIPAGLEKYVEKIAVAAIYKGGIPGW